MIKFQNIFQSERNYKLYELKFLQIARLKIIIALLKLGERSPILTESSNSFINSSRRQ